MTGTHALRHRIGIALIVQALAVGFAPAAFAQTDEHPSAPGEGIKVIGNWTIVVRDEAGKEVQRSEFRNALQGQGKPTLASLLSRGRAISEWLILLGNGSLQYFNGLQPCGSVTPTDKECGLVERVSSQLPFVQSVVYSPGLTVGTDPTDPSRMVLSGSMKVGNTSAITSVSTMLSLCPPGPPSPTGCTSTQVFAYFSGTSNFTNPPMVSPGQTVDVTVAFTFQ